jgi:hypothetical protein
MQLLPLLMVLLYGGVGVGTVAVVDLEVTTIGNTMIIDIIIMTGEDMTIEEDATMIGLHRVLTIEDTMIVATVVTTTNVKLMSWNDV